MVSPPAIADTSRSIARPRSAMPSGGRRSARRGARKRAARSASAIPRATSRRAVSGRRPIAVARAATFDSSIDGACQAIAVISRPRYHRGLWITFFLQAFGVVVAARRAAGLAALLAALAGAVLLVQPDQDRAGDEDRRVGAHDDAHVHGEREVPDH